MQHRIPLSIIPPQFFRVESPILRSGYIGRPFVTGTSIRYLGEKMGSHVIKGDTLFLDSVGVYEGHSSIDDLPAGIIDNDIHLERFDDRLAEAMGKMLMDESWQEMTRKKNGRVRRA